MDYLSLTVLRKMLPRLIGIVTLLLLAHLTLLVHASSSAQNSLCDSYPPRTITYDDLEKLSRQYPLPNGVIDDYYKGIEPTDKNYKDYAWDLATTPELGLMGGGVTLANLSGLTGGGLDTILTNLGGAVAVVQFALDINSGNSLAQVNFAKSTSFWAIGTFNFSSALKISAVGIGLIDYSLNQLGNAGKKGKLNYWYKSYKNYYDQKYGHHVDDMSKWEKLIFQDYRGDVKKALSDGMLGFWGDPFRKSYEKQKYIWSVSEPTREEKEQIRDDYLSDILPILQNYFSIQQNESQRKARFQIQSNYDDLRAKLQKAVIFSGTVTSEDGSPLQGADVTLFKTQKTSTAADGSWVIPSKACEVYQLQLSRKIGTNVELTASYQPPGAIAPVEKTETIGLQIVSGIFTVGRGAEPSTDQPPVAIVLPVRTVEKLVLSPLEVGLKAGGTALVKATLEYNDGTQKDVTPSGDCTWKFDKKGIVSVDKGKLSLMTSSVATEKVKLSVICSVNGKQFQSTESITITIEPAEKKLKLLAIGSTKLSEYKVKIKVLLVLPDGTEEDITASKGTSLNVSPGRPGNVVSSDGSLELTTSTPCDESNPTFTVTAEYATGSETLISNAVKYEIHEDYTVVPCDSGEKVEAYRTLLAKRTLKGLFTPILDALTSFCDSQDGGWIETTIPWSGEIVRKGSVVEVDYYADSKTDADLFDSYLKVPDILRLTRKEAEQSFQGVELELSFLEPLMYDANFPVGVVKRQGPVAGECVKKGSKVVATLNPSPDIQVPDLIGKSETEGKDIVRPLPLILDVRTAKKWQRGYGAGVIIRQDPKAGTGKIVKPGSTIIVWLNPSLPSMGIKVHPDQGSYPMGTELTFTQDVWNLNPNNSYTFSWEVKGDPSRKGDSFSKIFDTPGVHYVQLIVESSDPSENDALIQNIHIDYPPDPTVTISVSPAGPYTPNTQVTFNSQVTNLPDAKEYGWSVNGKYVGSGIQFPYKLGGKGKYEISLKVLRDNGDELKAEITISVGDEPIKPMGKWVNRFKPVGTTANLKVCSSYWVGGKGSWSNCTNFDTVGAVDSYDLYTGAQAGGHNSGWIAYTPTGSNRLLFRVYGFRFGDPGKTFGAWKGYTNWNGRLDTRGTLIPSSIRFISKQSRAGTLQWQTDDNKTCSARIWKFKSTGPGTITKQVFITGGVDNKECVETGSVAAGSDPGMGFTPNATSIAGANQIGNQFQNSGSSGSGSSSTSSSGSSGNLANVTVSQNNITITVWDHGQEDGDIINMFLNGKLLKGKILLTKKKKKFDVLLKSGSNTFEIEAVNEGSVSPNTASVRISNVTQGRSAQVYERKSGKKADMKLFAP